MSFGYAYFYFYSFPETSEVQHAEKNIVNIINALI